MTSNTNNHDERWMRLVDAENAGEYLPPEDRDFLKQYQSPHKGTRTEQLLLIQTAQLGLPNVEDQAHHPSDHPPTLHSMIGDEQMVTNVLDQWIQERSTPSTHPRSILHQSGLWKRLIRRFTWFHYSGILGTSIATLAMWWFLDTDNNVLLGPQPASQISSSSVHSHHLYLLSGSALINQRPVEASAPVPLSKFPEENTKFVVTQPLCIGTWKNQSSPSKSSQSSPLFQSSLDTPSSTTNALATATHRHTSSLPSADHQSSSRICFTQGSLGNWSSTSRTIVLDKGQAQVTTTKQAPSFALIKLGDAEVQLLDLEGQYHIESKQKNAWSISVQSGFVEITHANGSVRNLKAGERLSVGEKVGEELFPSSPPTTEIHEPPQSTAANPPLLDRHHMDVEAKVPKHLPAESEMLAKARRLHASGDIKKAAAVLQKLVSRKNLSDPSKIAMLSLGQIYMRLKQPQRALHIYTKYLRSGSTTLIEEAELGRIDALHALGESKRERNAVESFLERHPASTYADTLRRKLQNRP